VSESSGHLGFFIDQDITIIKDFAKNAAGGNMANANVMYAVIEDNG